MPALESLGAEPLLGQCVGDGRDEGVDGAEAFALARFLGGGEAPGDFPVRCGGGGLVGVGLWGRIGVGRGEEGEGRDIPEETTG